jgi:hypothetical protein
MKKKRKRTPEERATERARHDDLLRRLQAAIDSYRARAEGKRSLRGETDDQDATFTVPVRKRWSEMSRAERLAERARSADLDRRLLAAIERYRVLAEEKRRQREAEAS